MMQDTVRAMLAGEQGEARQFAARTLSDFAERINVNEFVTVKHAHLVGSYWSGDSNIALLESLLKLGGSFKVPTTINASSACLQKNSPTHSNEQIRAFKTVNQLIKMGAEPTLTCAPYHLPLGLEKGDNVAWAESNAIVYANSVMAVRTNKTPQYIDMMAALCGFMPKYGRYCDEGRTPTVMVECDSNQTWTDSDYQLFGLWLGGQVGSSTPLIRCEQRPTDDQLRGFGANTSASGDVSLFHWFDVTSEANQYRDTQPLLRYRYTEHEQNAIKQAFMWQGEAFDEIRVGTPHASIAELDALITLFKQVNKPSKYPFIVSTSRHNKTLFENQHGSEVFAQYNIQLIVDTCTYYPGPLPLPPSNSVILTTSGKWAYYAKGNLGVTAKIVSLTQCVALAIGE